jgi:HD-GYP domain-containing protein (c-di-GMP phosphodiesterase class II)
MKFVSVEPESIRIGVPLPFPLVDKSGILLAKKSFVIASKKDLTDIVNRGGGLYLYESDAQRLHRAYVDQLQTQMRDEKPLGEIAKTKPTSATETRRRFAQVASVDWHDLQTQTTYLLRDSNPDSFQERLNRISEVLRDQAMHKPDSALFALIHLSASESIMYSATHAMLVSVMCSLASKQVLNWSEQDQVIVSKAALTMNLGMSELQDKLAVQVEPITPTQRAAIDGHAQRSSEILQTLGQEDALLLGAVREHHIQTPGPLSAREPAHRLARLIQRADMFAARLSPRASRTPISPAAAMQACYFEADKQVDEAGAAILKAVGIYQPGSYVKLANNEVAVVIKRGANTTTPRVAVVVNRDGLSMLEPTVRDTSQKEFQVLASIAHREVKVKINLERMLLLSSSSFERPI